MFRSSSVLIVLAACTCGVLDSTYPLIVPFVGSYFPNKSSDNMDYPGYKNLSFIGFDVTNIDSCDSSSDDLSLR